MIKLEDKVKVVIKDAADKIHGAERRLFIAQTTITMLGGSARKAETEFGWWRETVNKGMHELKSNSHYPDKRKDSGAKRSEDKRPRLAKDIREIVEPTTQADPTLRTTLAYTRITACGVRTALITQKGYRAEDLPCPQTFNNILNRMGYSLKRVRKCKPLKKDTRN